MKGVWADGLGFHINNNVVIIEAVISKPRAEIPTIASRIIFPRSALEAFIKKLSEGLEMQKAKEEEAKEKLGKGK